MKNWIYYVIAILLGIDNVFVAKRIGFLSFDRLFEIIIFIYFFKSFLIEFKTNNFFRKFTQFLLLFAFLKLLMNFRFLIIGEIDLLSLLTEFFKGLTFIIYSFLFLILLKKGLHYLKVICWVHLTILIFALLQHPLSPIASQVMEIKKEILTSNDSRISRDLSNEEVYISGGVANRFRLSGPFAYSIPFAYFAFSSFILNFFLYIKTNKKFYLLMLALLLLTAFLSQTRSLILGILLISLGYIFFKKEFKPLHKINLFFFSLIALMALVIAINSVSIETRISSTKSSGGEDNRPLLWATGLLAVIEHPFGVTDKDYKETKLKMYRAYGGGGSILTLPSHNGLINVGFEYTLFGYFLFLLFSVFIFKKVNDMPTNMKLLFKLSLIGYLIHSSFHNNFILYADYPILTIVILIGFESDNWINSQNTENESIVST